MNEKIDHAQRLKKLVEDYKTGKLKTYSFEEFKQKNDERFAKILAKHTKARA